MALGAPAAREPAAARCAGRWRGGSWRRSSRSGSAADVVVFSEEKLLGGPQHVFSRADLPAGASGSAALSPASAPGGRDALPVDPQLRRPAALGLRQELKVDAADRRRLRRHPGTGGRASRRAGSSWCAGSAPRPRACRSGYGGRRTIAANRGDPREALRPRPVGPLPEIADPAWTRSPLGGGDRGRRGAAGVDALAERRARVRAIFARRRATGEARFQPFSAEDRRLLRAAYAADLERIAGLAPAC